MITRAFSQKTGVDWLEQLSVSKCWLAEKHNDILYFSGTCGSVEIKMLISADVLILLREKVSEHCTSTKNSFLNA